MRYRGQGHEIEVTLPNRDLSSDDLPALREAFETEYRRQFQRTVPDMVIEILNWALWTGSRAEPIAEAPPPPPPRSVSATATRRILCDVTGDWREAAVFDRGALAPATRLQALP